MSYPANEKEWWSLVDAKWNELIDMASDQLDMNSPAFEEPGDPASVMTGRNVLQEMNYLKNSKQTKLARYFNAIWGLASERYAYSKPGWSELCDLCSEEYVLYE